MRATAESAPLKTTTREKIRLLCIKQSSSESLQDEHGLYIPPSASQTTLLTNTKPLTADVNDFIESNRSVMLILGESGSGKSFFCENYIKIKSEEYQPSKRIPIFCSLPTLRNLNKGLMVEILKQHGFTREEVEELRSTKQRILLMLDAYDETKSERNICRDNDLMDEWDVKVIFTCRESYLKGDTDYSRFFIPYNERGAPAPDYFQELYIAPFEPGQVGAYIKQFLKVREKSLRDTIRSNVNFTEDWLKPETYQYWIENLPGLKELVKNPFLLRLTMEVLPNVVIEYQSEPNNRDTFRITSMKLYEKFVNFWFARQSSKLMGNREILGREFVNECKTFAKALAKRMHDSNLSVVFYRDGLDKDNVFDSEIAEDGEEDEEMKKWAIFFSDQLVDKDRGSEDAKRKRILWRRACPIKPVGSNQWAFLHDELRDYFYTLVLNDQRPQNRNMPVARSRPQQGDQESLAVAPAQAQAHRKVRPYELMNRFNPDEAKELLEREGIKIVFDPGEMNQKVVLGQGHFGKFRIARHLTNHRFVGVKKIRGDQFIRESEKEATLQRELNGVPNVMPIWDSQTVLSKKSRQNVLLQFMPLAGFGSGDKLISLLQFIQDDNLKNKFLIHILKSLVNGFKGMHSRQVRHLDMKPANFVIDCRGEVLIIDFGCAVREYGNKREPVMKGGVGDSHYFSPERLACYRKKKLKHLPYSEDMELADEFDAEKVDMWALGLTMLELFLENMRFLNGAESSCMHKVETWNSRFFTEHFSNIVGWDEASETTLLGCIKMLLDVNPSTRPRAAEILRYPILNDPKMVISSIELKRLMTDLIKWKTDPPIPQSYGNRVDLKGGNDDNLEDLEYSGVSDYLVSSSAYGGYNRKAEAFESSTESSEEEIGSSTKKL